MSRARIFVAPRWRMGCPAAGSELMARAGRLLVLLCALGAASAAFAADEIHWTLTGQTSVTFDWRGTNAEEAIRYGTSPGVYTDIVLASPPSPLPFSSSGPFWEARLTGLQEDTLYYYAIGNGPERTFRTPPPRGDSHFTVYAEGDIGSTNSSFRVADVQDLIANGLPAFALMVGDLTYGDSHGQDDVDQHFNDVMAWSRETAYMPAWGNHEWATGDDLRNYKGRFDLPNPQTSPGSPAVSCCGEDWYWFDYGNVRFIAYPEPWSGAWTDWNTKATTLMAAAQADPAISFIVTFGHRPAYSSGGAGGNSTLRPILDALGDRYRKYVLNLAGHVHDYERSLPQHGVVHVVVGTGGDSLQTLSTTQPSWSALRAAHVGALRVHFTATGIEGAFICGPASSIDSVACTLGSVVDSFTIGTVGSDQSPPAVKITAPGSGPTVFGTTAVTALAADNVGVVGVQFQLDGNALGGEATTAPYAVAWDTTTATAGAHVLTAVARDAAGNTATSPEVPVTVNNDVTTLTVPPSADATIQFDFPTSNYGAASSLEVDRSPLVKDILMKFAVSGVGTRPVLGARLRLHVIDASGRGGRFHRVADSAWSEQTVTWDTAPAADPTALASLGAVSVGTWVEVDLTSLITGDGVFSLRVTATSRDGADYSSREAAGFAPQLLVTVANQAPGAPTNLTATAASGSRINLAWTDNAGDEGGFKIERSTDGSTFAQIATVGADVTTVSNTGLRELTTYWYRVRAFNATGDSAYSNTASASTRLAAPSDLKALPVSQTQINLTWKDNSAREDGVKIERCQGSSCTNFVEVATLVGANVTAYPDTGLTTATTYRYRVRAYNAGGTSAYSNTATGATQ